MSEKSAFSVENRFDEKSYEVLKTLLLPEERQRLEALELYFQNPTAHAQKISLALPLAIKEADPRLLRDALDDALKETVENCLIESVHKEPALYVDALYPVILPMIKKSIAESFKKIMQSLNSAVEEGLSIHRLGWHYQAWRAGIPYREIVLRNTLAYRVEQAFLIHRETGLLLRHVSINGVDELRDSDAVSAMLTAIQDFTQDSFSRNDHDQLNSVEVGDYTVFLNRGAYAMLACVIQGIPPYPLREEFEHILGLIHQQHINLLKNFEGDSEPLAVIDTDLEQCLLSERKKSDEKAAAVSGKYILIPLFLILLLIGYWYYERFQFEQRGNEYLTLLHEYDGVVVTETRHQGGKWVIKGLYDPLIVNPNEVLSRSRLQADEVITTWQAYHSLAPSIVVRRLQNVLEIPPYVNIQLHKTQLILSGIADAPWIQKIKKITPALTGVTQIDTQKLQTYTQAIKTNLDVPNTVTFIYHQGVLTLKGVAPLAWHAQITQKTRSLKFIEQVQYSGLEITEEKTLQRLKNTVEGQAIYFTGGSTINVNNTKMLEALIGSLEKMQRLSQQLNKTMRLIITGYTDGLDTTEYNTALGHTRAQKIIDVFKPHLLSVKMQTASKLSERTYRGNKRQRKVNFNVIFTQEPLQK